MNEINLNSFKSLTIFKALYENGTATKAAHALGITQSGVSRSLAQLEEQLGLPLFVRDRNRLVSTPEAEELYNSVLGLMLNLDELKHSILALREFGASRVRIAGIPGLAFGYIPKLIARMLAINPKLNIYFDIMSTHDVIRSVEAGLFDLGFLTLPAQSEQLAVEQIVKTRAVCLLPRKHRLARKKQVHLKDLTGEHLVVPNQPNIAADQLLRLISEHRIRLGGKTEANIAGICALVGSGVGLSVINPITAQDLGHKETVVRPFMPSIHYEFGLIYRHKWQDNKLLVLIRESLARNEY
ncbi:MAG: LysR family transcriptional regulator [Haliea sp.]